MKLKSFAIEGWDFYQYAYAIKWHKDRYGDPKTLAAAREKYQAENAEPPPTVEQFYDLDLTKALVKETLGNLLGQGNFEIKLTSDKEPKNGN